ncbi:MAG: hydrolase, partial [Pseudomonadota bacterium]
LRSTMVSIDNTQRSAEDAAAIERLNGANQAMLDETIKWAEHNTGSWNFDGLNAFAPTLADAFSDLDADVRLDPGEPFEVVGKNGDIDTLETGPILNVCARPDAPIQVVMSGHYDTVFPPNTFETISDMGDGRVNGPGLADMKGGLVVMLNALKAFEASALKDRLGYRIVVTPDEEIGNFASAPALTEAAQSGALIGMTYEPSMENGAFSGARKGSAVYDAVIKGRAAHAGRAKEDGASAIEAAAKIVVALEAMNGGRSGVSVNVGAIDGGSAVNIVPDTAIIRFGARAPTEQDAAWANDEISEIIRRETELEGLSGHLHGGFYRPPKPRNAAQEALFQAVTGAGKALGLSLEFVDTGGVCEGNNIFAAGVPNVDTLGVRGGRIHSADEFVTSDSFVERASLSALILNRLADGRIDGHKIKELMTART